MSKKNDNDELIGFREFIEHDEKKRPAQRSERYGIFEVQTFLEREIKRVSAILDLVQDKSLMVSQYPQKEKLLQKIEIQKVQAKKEITELALTEESTFSQNISELWEKHFNT